MKAIYSFGGIQSKYILKTSKKMPWETKQFNVQMGKGNRFFSQKRSTDGQYTYENVLNMTKHQYKANQNHNNNNWWYNLTTVRMAIIKKPRDKHWWWCRQKGTSELSVGM